MSIQSELQGMLDNTEPAVFLTKEKQKELREINEAFFAPLAETGHLIHSAIQTLSKVKSKVGKELEKVLGKMDMNKWEKEVGVKNLEELDEKLGAMKVNDPEFSALMKQVVVKTEQAKTHNKELYTKLSPITDKHLKRLIEYFEYLLENAKDDQQAMMYYGILISMMGWLDETRNKDLRESIKRTMSDRMDTKSLETLKNAPESKKPITPAEKDVKDNINQIENQMRGYNVLDKSFMDVIRLLSEAILKTPKNDPAYAKMQEVFNTSARRYVEALDTLMRNTKDPEKILGYMSQLESFEQFLSTTTNKDLRNEIKQTIMRYTDRQTIRTALGKEISAMPEPPAAKGTAEDKEAEFFKKFDNLPGITKDQIAEMTEDELKMYINSVDKYRNEELDQGYMTLKKGNLPKSEVEIDMHLKDMEAYAEKLLKGKAKSKAAKPEKTPKEEPIKYGKQRGFNI